ncbi:Ubiquitin-like-specific protease 1A [Hirschfeldia incana]|nr:Ubiquitin-like-specific protease 1A [Hirschfeldia incana]
MAPGNYRYPQVKTPLRRQVHAPSPVSKFGFFDSTREIERSSRSTRNYRSLKRNALDLPLRNDELDYVEKEVSLGDVKLKNGSLVMVDAVTDVSSYEAYRKVIKSAENRACKLKDRGFGGALKERCRGLIRSLRSFLIQDEEEEPVEDERREPFRPLSKEDEIAVKQAFSANVRNILVTHENSNIDITGATLRCLQPGQWLNDEVINLYLVLLKEREAREPNKFLKCHFFNTFFFTKLVHSGTGYNYGAVRRWTSVKKLGYHLIDCDKLFIPIHMNIHWTLAIINIKDRKFQYLDSFKGREPRILDAMARYFADDVKDKSEVDIDVSQWRQEFVQSLPEQSNGFDCGMFMIKYIDFYSRGLDLCFTQEHMPYFRVRTAKEILQLKA